MKRKAYVTGADRGLGLALTEALIGHGYKVYAGSYLPDWPELVELSRRYSAEELAIVPLDVTDTASVRQAARRIGEDTDELHVLVNNAGTARDRSGTILEEQVEDDIRNLFETNTLGPLRVTQSVLPLLLKSEAKTLVNISSIAGSVSGVTRINQYGYTMSKAALNMQSKLIHNHLKDSGLKVLVVHPGWMHSHIFGDLERMKNAPLQPADSARAIVKLIQTRTVIDETLYVDYEGSKLDW